MPKILLIDPSGRFANTLVPTLERRSHAVHLATGKWDALASLKNGPFDVVAVDLSANRASDWELLDAVRTRVVTLVPRPRLLCISDFNWGPSMKLDVEGKGGRFVLIHG